MYMVLCVIDDPGKVDRVLEALEAGGIRGATILESSGLHRKRQKRIPMPYLYVDPGQEEVDNVTIFTVVEDKAVAEKYLSIIESVLGNMDQPNTGIFAAWQLDMVKGITHHTPVEGTE